MEEGGETDEEAGDLHDQPADASRELNLPQSVDQRHRAGGEFPVGRGEEVTLNKHHREVDVGSEQQLVAQVFITVTL